MKKIKDFLSRIFNKKEECNYLYFVFLFTTLMVVNIFHLVSVFKSFNATSWFFLCFNIGQNLILVLALMFLSVLIKAQVSKKFYYGYIGLVFVLLFSLVVESLLVLLMDISFFEALQLAFGSDFENFIELLYLSDMGIETWIGLLLVMIMIPFLGIFFYKWGENLQKKNPLFVYRSTILKGMIFSAASLLTLDLVFFNEITPIEFENHKKTLLWKTTFLKTNSDYITFKKPILIKNLEKEGKGLKVSFDKGMALPNIYLFVVESLREDYINEKTAPFLTSFKNNHIFAEKAFASANCTHDSWFSLFHSVYSFYWSYKKTKQFYGGSLPLNILKKVGYKIHVYSSAQLKFYHFDEVIFGKDRQLADTYKKFLHYADKEACYSDREAINTLMKDSSSHEKEGNVYIIFLDSTHFNYSWPKDFPEKFTPTGEVSWKHRLSNDPLDLEILKNRYRNSIAFVDDLFSKVMTHLETLGHYKESIVVFCGDHGEEFKEEGKLFHASHLSDVQVKIPLFYKFGSLKRKISMTSHVDIFPSMFHYLFNNEQFKDCFDGYSILNKDKPKFAVTARYNAAFEPYKFSIYNQTSHALFRFSNKNDVSSSKSIKVITQLKEEDKLHYEQLIHQAFCSE